MYGFLPSLFINPKEFVLIYALENATMPEKSWKFILLQQENRIEEWRGELCENVLKQIYSGQA